MKLFSCFLIIVLSSCSNIRSSCDNNICGINGDDDYLKITNKSDMIHAPSDLRLPFIDNTYEIPNVIIRGEDDFKIGKNLNIYPPKVLY